MEPFETCRHKLHGHNSESQSLIRSYSGIHTWLICVRLKSLSFRIAVPRWGGACSVSSWSREPFLMWYRRQQQGEVVTPQQTSHLCTPWTQSHPDRTKPAGLQRRTWRWLITGFLHVDTPAVRWQFSTNGLFCRLLCLYHLKFRFFLLLTLNNVNQILNNTIQAHMTKNHFFVNF